MDEHKINSKLQGMADSGTVNNFKKQYDQKY